MRESQMTRRERILAAIEHRPVDKVPIGFDIFEPVREGVLRYFGADCLENLYEKSGIEGFSVWDWPSAQPRYIGPKREGVDVYDRSMAYGCWGKVGERIYPLRGKKLDEYRWPTADDFDFSHLKEELSEIRSRDMTTASGHAGCGWLHHVQMRSYDEIFYDVLDNAFMEEYMARNRAFYLDYFTRLFEAADGLIDIIRADEDLGGQQNMLLSPELWRKWYKPLWKEVFAIAKQHGAKIWLHSCGYCYPLVRDFIEIGVDILNPLPPYVRDSDPAAMKAEFGSMLCFDGGVDQMNVLVQGTPEQVRQEVKLRMEQLAPGSGYIVGPSQVIEKDIPLENAIAFFKVCLEYGQR